MIKKTSKGRIKIAAIFLLAASLFSIGLPAFAILPFGGTILFMTGCTGGVLLTIGPPRPGNFLQIWGASFLFPYRAVHYGAWTLGLAFPGGACCCPNGCCYCGCIASTGTIEFMGTSF